MQIKHEDFDDRTLRNDILLLQLEYPVNTRIYTPICLASLPRNYTGRKGDYKRVCEILFFQSKYISNITLNSNIILKLFL